MKVRTVFQDLLSHPGVKTQRFHCRRGTGLIPGLGTKIPYATRCDKKKKKKRNLLDTSTKINSELIFKIYQILHVYYMPGTVLSTLHVLYHYVSPPQPCELGTVIPFDRWGDWGPERTGHLCKVIDVGSNITEPGLFNTHVAAVTCSGWSKYWKDRTHWGEK